MADKFSGGSSLSKVFWSVAGFTASTLVGAAIGFYTFNLVDFAAMHSMREGVALTEAASPHIAQWLRADFLGMGFSVADTMVGLTDWFNSLGPTASESMIASAEGANELMDRAVPNNAPSWGQG